MSRDDIYAEGDETKPFEFSSTVVSVFEDMIRRSVPGYGLTLTAIEAVAGLEVQPGTRVYDLGCSLGAGIEAVHRGVFTKDALRQKPELREVRIIGVDSSPAMLKRARALIGHHPEVELAEGDATDWSMENASLIILNFTLQFVPLAERKALLKRCYDALVPRGVIFLSEKFISPNPSDEEWLRELHWEFKRQQGYSELEIARKREALEKVLIPESLETHEERLCGVGFTQVTRVLQCLNFASWVVRK